MKRESKSWGKLEDINNRTRIEDENIHIEQWCPNDGDGLVEQ